MARAPDDAVPFFDIADPAFSVTSAQVGQAREAGWYARTCYGLAVLRYDQVSRLIRHPDLRQGSRLWPAHHGITSGPFADWWANWVLNMEGEEHHRLRRLLNPAFSRRIVEPLRPRFAALAAELIDGFADDIQNASQRRGSDRDGYRSARIDRFHASYQTFGRLHSNAAATPLTQVLLNFHRNAYRLGNVKPFAQDF